MGRRFFGGEDIHGLTPKLPPEMVGLESAQIHSVFVDHADDDGSLERISLRLRGRSAKGCEQDGSERAGDRERTI